MFLVLAAVVVVPADLLVDGLWAGTLGQAGTDTGPAGLARAAAQHRARATSGGG